MRKIFLSILVLSFLFCDAQLLQDRITGKYYRQTAYTDVRGTPYLYDDWRPSLITYNDGLQLKNVKIKFDLYENTPLFLRNDSAFEFVNEVAEFVIYNPGGDSVVFRNGFNEGDGIGRKTYLQVVEDGKIVLAKHIVRMKVERKEFNSASTIVEFSSPQPALYVFYADKGKKVKKDESVLRDGMKDKWDKISQYMQTKGLSMKKEADIVTAVRYYNSL